MKEAVVHPIPGLIIRKETPGDHRAVEEMTREAFWNRYAPGCNEHYLVHLLRREPGFRPWHSLVAEYDGHVIGHALLSPSLIALDEGSSFPVYALGPLTVLPAVSLRGIGSSLMIEMIKLAKGHGAAALMLTGDPKYYQHFGFITASRLGIRLHGIPPGDEAAYFMALPLYPGALDGKKGVFIFSPLFDIGEGLDFMAYDSGFPKREKLRLPGQLPQQ